MLTPLCQFRSNQPAALVGSGFTKKRPSKDVLQLLRLEARASRQRQRVPFYSIREVAHHFGLPNTTVSRLFDQLKDEGLLSTLWGSGTLLESTEMDRQRRVRAVVAMPIALISFSTIKNYRDSVLRVSEELWKLGFAPRLVFHERNDAESSRFAELLLSYRADLVVWFCPTPGSETVTARLAENGTRSVIIEGPFCSALHRSYLVNRANALLEGLTAWRHEGVASVALVENPGSSSNEQKTAVIEGCLRAAGMPYAFYATESDRSLKMLLAFSKKNENAIIFSESSLVVALGTRAPAALGRLLRDSRVMLADGPLEMPAVVPSDTLVDVIGVNWQLAAQRIGRDLMKPNVLAAEEPCTLEALWLPRMPVR